MKAVYPRNKEGKLYDHVTKKMAPLIVRRFDLIPTKWGANWRDLPNKVVMLSDRSKKQVLEYNHRDTTCGNGPNGAFRGYVRAPSDNPSTRQKTSRQTPWSRGACRTQATSKMTGQACTAGWSVTASSPPLSPTQSKWASRVVSYILSSLGLSLSMNAPGPKGSQSITNSGALYWKSIVRWATQCLPPHGQALGDSIAIHKAEKSSC